MTENENETLDELTLLKESADKMGITYSPNIGVDTLRERVNAALGDDEGEGKEDSADVTDTNTDEGEDKNDTPSVKKQVVLEKSKPALTKRQLEQNYHTRLRREANKLVRVQMSCMNPNKKNNTGEIFSISNAVIGTVKKFIPYNMEAPYHIPYAIYKQLKERKYQHHSEVKLPNGFKKKVTKMMPEFNIMLLDPLTPEELKDLKQRQALNNSVD